LVAGGVSPQAKFRPQLRSLFEPAPPSDCILETVVESNVPVPSLAAPITAEPSEKVMGREPSVEFPIIAPPTIQPRRGESASQAADAPASVSLPIRPQPIAGGRGEHDDLRVAH